MIVTGGWDNPTRVDVYNMNGWSRELPELNTGRYLHGCGKYMNTDDKMVNCITGNNQYQYSHIQVYLVTGGRTGSNFLSSTETLEEGAGSWTPAGVLPVALFGLRGVSLNNNIFMTGNFIIHKLLVINILILQEDMMEIITVTTFYNSTLMMDLGKKLVSCSKADATMVQVWSMLKI